jgi:chemotaxis protein MotB
VFPTNWELSAARATSVVRYLEDAVGIDPRRLSAVGFGPNRPMDANDTPEGRARNRRIEIKLLPLDALLLTPVRKEPPPPRP